MPFPLLAAAGLASSLGKIGLGFLQNSKANKINPQWQQYQANPLAAQMLGTAQNAYNGRMAGAQAEENAIYNNQANTQASVERNATDSSQALALAMAGQGATNDALNNLQTKEAQNKYNLLGNLNNAYKTNIDEGDKVYNSMLQKYQMDTQAKQQLRSSAFNNIFGGANDLVSGGLLGMYNFGGGGAKDLIDNKMKNPLSNIVQTAPKTVNTAYGSAPQSLPTSFNMPSMALLPNQVPMQGAANPLTNYSSFNWLGK